MNVEEEMRRHTQEWLKLNRRLFRAAEELRENIRPVATKAQFECICCIFLERGAKTLRAVNVLYENKLDDQGQALIRILIENWINFSWFIRISDSERERGIRRFWDALNLDYFKQLELQSETDMDDSPIMRKVRATEAEIRSRYAKGEFKSLQRHGFTLRNIEQRMRELGYWTYYRYFFRPISRSIHASDHLELRARLFDPNRHSPIEDTCFALAQWSLWGICDELNRRGRLDFGKKLADIALALGRLKMRPAHYRSGRQRARRYARVNLPSVLPRLPASARVGILTGMNTEKLKALAKDLRKQPPPSPHEKLPPSPGLWRTSRRVRHRGARY